MSGASLTVTMHVGPVQNTFQRLATAVADTTPVMRAIGTGLVASTHDRFGDAVDPDGAPWTALNPAYAAGKRGPGILRESAMRGGLMGSITYRAGRDRVTVGSNKIYGAIHQFGGTIRAKGSGRLAFRIGGRFVRPASVAIPARPFLGVGAEDRTMIVEVVTSGLARALGSAASSLRRR